jgi:hypothetical protein
MYRAAVTEGIKGLGKVSQAAAAEPPTNHSHTNTVEGAFRKNFRPPVIGIGPQRNRCDDLDKKAHRWLPYSRVGMLGVDCIARTMSLVVDWFFCVFQARHAGMRPLRSEHKVTCSHSSLKRPHMACMLTSLYTSGNLHACSSKGS